MKPNVDGVARYANADSGSALAIHFITMGVRKRNGASAYMPTYGVRRCGWTRPNAAGATPSRAIVNSIRASAFTQASMIAKKLNPRPSAIGYLRKFTPAHFPSVVVGAADVVMSWPRWWKPRFSM